MPLYTRKNTTASELIYEGGIINLRVDEAALDGKKVIRETVEHNGGVVIACQPSPQQIVLVKQYRYSVDEELIELPAGRIEKGEDPFPAAKRELAEETGYTAKNWLKLAQFYSAPGFCNEILYLYSATDVTLSAKALDEDEETEVILVTLKEAWQLVNKGHVRDAKTIAGISLACFQHTLSAVG